MTARLHAIGFFEELRHGDPQGPSLRDAVAAPLPAEQRDAVADYLGAATVIVATSARADDVLDPTRTDVSGINVRTDGVFVWSEDLSYYVRAYGAKVPDALVRRALAGPPPAFSAAEIDALADAFPPAE